MSLTLGTLITEYQIDPDSSFHELKHEVRVRHRRMLARIAAEKGEYRLRDVRPRTLVAWQRDWVANGKAAMASALTGRLSAVFRFGATILEDRECARLFEVLSLARVQASSTPRISRMTADQATALRNKAREIGYFSIALAQALQFELRLTQKEVLGEWVPNDEADPSDVSHPKYGKWIRGLRWEQIDEELILRMTTKRSRVTQHDLKVFPMVMEELAHAIVFYGGKPSAGPVVIYEASARPWSQYGFRRIWRKIANIVGIPAHIRNSDLPA
ncbi:hypothetical protein SAMN05216573_112120 [Bradyrhizobium sp. Rc3b]|uniref:hypothetical protein n=1 Tax=Bradyrhizobium sp. Rc3b TaxID=1855322 RepID=UPI0008E7FDB2|nr:hypothetical protein [Bradyrhizobium sp. Rc3b]SFN38932.1 hypothetical protein SAMN05216573_112120 [Bradyrhizobium sp. Rc3b]